MDYLDGNLDAAETASLKKRLSDNGERSLLHHLRLAQKAMIEHMEESAFSIGAASSQSAKEIAIHFDHNGKKGSTIMVLDPMRLAAAKNDGYLCDIECEE